MVSYPIVLILSGPTIGPFPVLAVIYVAGVILSIAMSLFALCFPVPTSQWMDNQARQRARPWLATASVLLLIASITVTTAILWIASYSKQDLFDDPPAEVIRAAIWGDLGISILIMLAVLCLGQAVVAYEIFTGKTYHRLHISNPTTAFPTNLFNNFSSAVAKNNIPDFTRT